MKLIFFCLLTLYLVSCHTSRKAGRLAGSVSTVEAVSSADNIGSFENDIEHLRIQYHIPGLSAGIVNNKKLIWKKGFGWADIENNLPPDENTVYQIASVSKTFGSILLMQLVEAGKVNLDDPISKYNINLGARWGSDPRIKLRHLLTHTAMGGTFNGFKPGYQFRYNGDWYGQLKLPIEQASRQSYGELLMKQIILPLGLKLTAPSIDDTASFKLTGYDIPTFKMKIAKPYDWSNHQLIPIINFRYNFGPAAGIMSTVNDLSLYSIAIDEQKFLSAATWKDVFTPYVTKRGKKIQYGLGWFVKNYKNTTVIWHTGWWTGYAALFIKIPSKDLTFILLANSQDLSRPFYKTSVLSFLNPFRKNLNNDLRASAFARAFLHHFAGL